MISGTIALAFTAGMVATFNPCGFSLLPAYIGVFVSGDDSSERIERRVAWACGVAAAVSVGFVFVFTTIGLIIDSIASEARRQLPWVTIVIGGLLIVAGIATLAGWKPTLALPGLRLATGTNNGFGMMVGYGMTYAIASLSCTIGPFLAVTGTAFSRSPVEGIATYVAYALGMGVIVLMLSVASVLAQSTVAEHLRRLSRIAPRVGGALMVIAGGYAMWYGRWELAVYDGDLDTDPIIEAIERVRVRFVEAIEGVGAQRIAVIVIVTAIGVTLTARAMRSPRSTSDDRLVSSADHVRSHSREQET